MLHGLLEVAFLVTFEAQGTVFQIGMAIKETLRLLDEGIAARHPAAPLRLSRCRAQHATGQQQCCKNRIFHVPYLAKNVSTALSMTRSISAALTSLITPNISRIQRSALHSSPN